MGNGQQQGFIEEWISNVRIEIEEILRFFSVEVRATRDKF